MVDSECCLLKGSSHAVIGQGVLGLLWAAILVVWVGCDDLYSGRFDGPFLVLWAAVLLGFLLIGLSRWIFWREGRVSFDNQSMRLNVLSEWVRFDVNEMERLFYFEGISSFTLVFRLSGNLAGEKVLTIRGVKIGKSEKAALKAVLGSKLSYGSPSGVT